MSAGGQQASSRCRATHTTALSTGPAIGNSERPLPHMHRDCPSWLGSSLAATQPRPSATHSPSPLVLSCGGRPWLVLEPVVDSDRPPVCLAPSPQCVAAAAPS